MSVLIEVDCEWVKARLDAGEQFLLLDCREPQEHATAAIDAATLIPMSDLAERISELEQHRELDIVVHCHHGGRSLRVALWLRQQGYHRAMSMAGGIDAWSLSIDTSITRY